jgi:hypothetical protein
LSHQELFRSPQYQFHLAGQLRASSTRFPTFVVRSRSQTPREGTATRHGRYESEILVLSSPGDFAMKALLAASAIVAALVVLPASSAAAKGCIKGAVVGGVAGHYAGHHGVLGAAAGCLYGRHHAKEQARQQQEQGTPPAGQEKM